MQRNRIWLGASGNMAAPQTPPSRPHPMATTPPRIRRQKCVVPGVTFVNAISRSVIWEVDERVTIGAAIHEILSNAFAQSRVDRKSVV